MTRFVQALVLAGFVLAAGATRAAEDGRDVFMRYCALCHGPAADGGGQMSRVLDSRPSDLRASALSRTERERIVRLGGASVSRSPSMPAWENELSGEQLKAVLGYLDKVRTAASASR